MALMDVILFYLFFNFSIYLFPHPMSETKFNPFLKKNPFLQYERFYSNSSSCLKSSTSSSTASMETSMHTGNGKSSNKGSDRKLPNPFSNGNSKNLMNGGKYDNIKKRKLVNPFHRKNLLYTQNLTEINPFEELKDSADTYLLYEPQLQNTVQ